MFEQEVDHRFRGKYSVVRADGAKAAVTPKMISEFIAMVGENNPDKRSKYLKEIRKTLTPDEQLDMLGLCSLSDAHDVASEFLKALQQSKSVSHAFKTILERDQPNDPPQALLEVMMEFYSDPKNVHILGNLIKKKVKDNKEAMDHAFARLRESCNIPEDTYLCQIRMHFGEALAVLFGYNIASSRDVVTAVSQAKHKRLREDMQLVTNVDPHFAFLSAQRDGAPIHQQYCVHGNLLTSCHPSCAPRICMS